MQTEHITKKFGTEVIKDFWIFIESLKFDSKTQESSVVRASLLKRLSPTTAGKYKEIADEFAFSLYRSVFSDKKSNYLYASFNVVAKGLQFYSECWRNPSMIEPLIDSLDQFNNFSGCLPIEDDYYNNLTTQKNSIIDDYNDYEYNTPTNGKSKAKYKDLDWDSIEE